MLPTQSVQQILATGISAWDFHVELLTLYVKRLWYDECVLLKQRLG